MATDVSIKWQRQEILPPKLRWSGVLWSVVFILISAAVYAPDARFDNIIEVWTSTAILACIIGPIVYFIFYAFVQSYPYFVSQRRWLTLFVHTIWCASLLPTINFQINEPDPFDIGVGRALPYIIAYELTGGSDLEDFVDKIAAEIDANEDPPQIKAITIQAIVEFLPDELALRIDQTKYGPAPEKKHSESIINWSLALSTMFIILIVLWDKIRARWSSKKYGATPFEDITFNTSSTREKLIISIQRVARNILIGSVFFVAAFWLSMLIIAHERGVDAVRFSLTLEGTLLIVCIALIALMSWSFAEGRKVNILFLRKFRNEGANYIVNEALNSYLGHRARLTVLADGAFMPTGVPMHQRLKSIGYILPFIAILVSITLYFPIAVGPIYETYNTKEDYFTGQITKNEEVINPNSGKTKWLSDFPFMDMPHGLSLWGLTILLFVPLLLSIFSAVASKLTVSTIKDVYRIRKIIAWSKSWFSAPRPFSPQAMIIATRTKIWKKTVQTLVDQCDIVILDISIETDPIKWELDLCRNIAPDRTIYLAFHKGDNAVPTIMSDHIVPLLYTGPSDARQIAQVIANHDAFLPSRNFIAERK